jgi:hypothetical protein
MRQPARRFGPDRRPGDHGHERGEREQEERELDGTLPGDREHPKGVALHRLGGRGQRSASPARRAARRLA